MLVVILENYIGLLKIVVNMSILIKSIINDIPPTYLSCMVNGCDSGCVADDHKLVIDD
jgi:hypothetical protein